MKDAQMLCARFLLALPLSALSACGGPSVNAAGHTRAADQYAEASSSQTKAPQTGASQPKERDRTVNHPMLAESEPPPAQALYAEVPPGGKLLGNSGGIAVEGLGAGGHWVAYCQAKGNRAAQVMEVSDRGEAQGDLRLHLYLGAEAEEIDALLASEERGRYLVVQKEGHAWLIDAVSKTRRDLTPLTPDLRADAWPDHRSFAFTESGLGVLSADGVYYLPLSPDGMERTTPLPIAFGQRPIWRLHAGTHSLTATTVSQGSPWPVPEHKQPARRCAQGPGPFSAFPRVTAAFPDPDLAYEFLPLPGLERLKPSEVLQASPAPGFVMPFLDGWVRRQASGRLVLVRGNTQKQIASENCGARILHADETSGLFLASCEEYSLKPADKERDRKKKPKYRFDLYLLKPAYVHPLGADTARTGVDVHGSTRQQLLSLRPGDHAALLGFDTRQFVPLEPGTDVLATTERSALLRRGTKLSLWTKEGEENVDVSLGPLDAFLTAGQTVSIGAQVFTLVESAAGSPARRVGEGSRTASARAGEPLLTYELPAPPLALSSQGYALIPKKAPTQNRWAEGPLLLLGPPEEELPEAAVSSSQASPAVGPKAAAPATASGKAL